MRYTKKPVEIEAVKFEGSTSEVQAIQHWMEGGEYHRPTVFTRDLRPMLIETLEGVMTATPGDYIIKGVRGEFYPCRADIFEQTYDPVDAQPQPLHPYTINAPLEVDPPEHDTVKM